jgi:hypothetical protein
MRRAAPTVAQPESEILWGELLSPDWPTPRRAVVLTGALAWAVASLLQQLVLISAAIFAAAVKYSFVAASPPLNEFALVFLYSSHLSYCFLHIPWNCKVVSANWDT